MADGKAERPLRVFLVEDHHIMRRGLASLLTTERNIDIVGEAGSGEEALELFESIALPDLVIMDVALPGANGIDTTRRIIENYPGVRVLVLSMYNNPTFVYQAMHAGASGYILKKSMVEELIAAIDHIVDGRQFISPIIRQHISPEGEPEAETFESLTRREIEVFELLAGGMSVKDIAEKLVVSIYTVYTHMNTIRRKMGVEKNSDFIRYAIENPLLLKNDGR